MTWNEEDRSRAKADLHRLKNEAINRLVNLHPDALPHGLNQYGQILRSRDLAEVMARRETRLMQQHAMELATLRRRGAYDRSWIGLLRLLRDLTLGKGLP